MAGKALRKKLLAEIDGRGGPEWLQDYIAEGGKISDLATELGCSRSYLSRHLNAHPDYKAVILEARSEYADKLADEALDIADGMASVPNITREQVAVAKERIDVRKWLSAVNDPNRFRQNNNGPNVTINVNQLHLEALKKHRDGGIVIDATVNPVERDGGQE
jgi:hypothetical protein